MKNYLGTTGLKHLISKVRGEIRELQELIAGNGDGDSGGEVTPSPSGWEEVQQIVRNGLAAETFAAGDTFQCNHDRYGTLTWQIVGFDADTPSDGEYSHSMTLQLKDPVQLLSFDGPDILHQTETELPAGDYSFWLSTTNPETGDPETPITIHVEETVPAGSVFVLRMPESGDFSAAQVEIYRDNTGTELLQKVDVSLGGTGTSLSPATYSESLLWGKGCWSTSAIRQYLNSDQLQGNVWSPVSGADGCPEWTGSLDGFRAGLDADFQSVLGTVTVQDFDYENSMMREPSDLFFLPSSVRVFADYPGNEYSHDAYEYYRDDTVSAGDPVNGAWERRIKTIDGTPCRWWLANGTSYDNTTVCIIGEDGSLSTANATFSGIGVAPMCCIV